MHKIIFYIIIFLFSALVNAQNISTSTFGSIQINMSFEEVSRLNPNQLAVLETTNEDMPVQDITINGIKYHIVYYKNLVNKRTEVYSVTSTARTLKTLSGIKIGSSLKDLWNVYKNYDVSIRNSSDNEKGTENATRVFILNDIDNGCYLAFYLSNNLVTRIALVNESGYLNNNIYEN